MTARLAHPYVLLVFAALFWAGSAVTARAVAGEVPPMALNFWRWLLAFLVVLAWTWPELRRHRRLIASRWRYLSFLALASAVGFGALHIVAMQFTTAINGSLFQGLMSVCILVAAWIMLGDRIGRREGLAVALGFAGVVAIVTRGEAAVVAGLRFNPGDLLLLAAASSYAIYAVSLRRAPPELSASALMAMMFLFASAWMLPLWLGEVFLFGRPLPLGFDAVWSIAYMTVCPSVLAQIFWARAVAEVGPGRAGYFIYLSPVFGVLLSMMLLGEVFRWYHAAGIVMIFAGIWLATRTPAADGVRAGARPRRRGSRG